MFLGACKEEHAGKPPVLEDVFGMFEGKNTKLSGILKSLNVL